MEKNEKARALELLRAASATGSGVRWDGGEGAFTIWGTFGGTSADLQFSMDNGTTYVNMSSTGTSTFSAAGGCLFTIGPCLLKVLMTGGSGISLTAFASPV